MSKKWLWLLSPVALWGCHSSHQIDTRSEVNVKPIHITIDINVKVDRALDDFFGDLDDARKKVKPEPIPASLQPDTAAAAAAPKTQTSK